MSKPTIVDIVDPDPGQEDWDEAYWIRLSEPRIYPTKDTPPVVAHRRAFLLALPSATSVLLPDRDWSISDLLNNWLDGPTPRQKVVRTKVEFTDKLCEPNPHVIVKALKNRPTFPPLELVLDLEKCFGQAWFNGNCSILDSFYTDLPLPFWVLTLWRELDYVSKLHAKWLAAEEYIRTAKHRDPDINLQLRRVVDHLTGLLHQVKWHAEICGFPCGWRPGSEVLTLTGNLSEGSYVARTTSFLQFFRNDFLDDEAINMMLHFIRLQVQRHRDFFTSVVIADLQFTRALLDGYSKPAPRPAVSALLTQYAELFTVLGRNQLYFVLNSGQNHWATIKVDFVLRTFAYGDSLAAFRAPEKPVISALTAWLKHVLPSGPAFRMGPNLPCDLQRDGWSCGIAACTLISSQLGFDEPWSPATAQFMRLTWASRLMKVHTQASGFVAAPVDTTTRDTAEPLPEPQSSNSESKQLVEQAGSLSDSLEKSLSFVSQGMDSGLPGDTKTHASNPNSSVLPVEALDAESDSVSMVLTDDAYTDISEFGGESSDVASEYAEGDLHALHSFDADGVLHFSDSDNDQVTDLVVSAPPAVRAGKHQRSDSHDAEALSTATLTKRPALFRIHAGDEPHCGPIGISRAARTDRAMKDAIAEGKFEFTQAQRAGLIRRARKYDEGAQLDPDDQTGRAIKHSICGKFVQLDGPGRTSKFARHVKTCVSNGGKRKNGKYTKAAAKTPTIDSIFKKKTGPIPSGTSSLPSRSQSPVPLTSHSPTPPQMIPCFGLRPMHDPRLENIIGRGPLGGRKSIHKIAEERYNTKYKNLTQAQKDSVQLEATGTASWIVHHDPQPHIRSAKCQSEFSPEESQAVAPDVCQKCGDLLYMREFQNALARQPAPEENLKYTPNDHRNRNAALFYGRFVGLKEFIEQCTPKCPPLIKLVIRTINGDLKDGKMFIGLVEAMATKNDKISRGKGMQNFTRRTAFIDFCHAALISSPQTYRLLERHFPMPSERNLRMRRSRAPQFPIGITNLSIERVVEYLAAIEYTGPVCISCDDTQLLSKMSPYFDGEKNKWLLLGGVGEAIEIDGDAKDVDKLITCAVKDTQKATKCRLWCLQVPMPGVPVFILAAMAIGSGFKAEELSVIHNQLINDLLARNIAITSYSCDGSATERKVARKFLQSASNSQTTIIPHPRPDFPSIPIILHRFGPRMTPIVTIQDAKHAAKTARNALYSGTRSMILGNCAIHYLQVLMLSKDARSPLYSRDVTRVDRQDDLAALRLFSSAFLQHVLCIAKEESTRAQSTSPLSSSESLFPDPRTVLKHDLTGLAVWIFTFGDFIDAFQNRFLGMDQRVTMVLRLRFFLEIWKASLKTLGYSESQHYISRDAEDIFGNLIHSFMALVLVYRDSLDHPHYPFCPWLHSTESCEHTFGEARKAKPDFTFGDFITMIPKLNIMANAAMETGDYDGNAKSRASGYYHTQYSSRDIDPNALSSFPSDSFIHKAAKVAYEEAEALFSLCGIPVTPELCPAPCEPKSSDTEHLGDEPEFTAPAIHEWFQDEEDALTMACEVEEPFSIGTELDRLLQEEETRGCATAEIDDRMEAYAAACIALDVEEQSAIEDMPDRNDMLDWQSVHRHLLGIFPPVNIRPLVFSDEINPSALLNCNVSSDFDFTPLVCTREAHETHFAKKAIRVGTQKPEVSITTVTGDSIDDNADVTPVAARSILIKQIHATLRSIEETAGSTAGASRRARHEGQFATQTGNAANASIVSKLQSGKALKARIDLFSDAKLKCASIVGSAGVTALSPIRTGSYVIVLLDDRLWVGEVLTMYSKGAGKGGKHNWVHEETNIASLSNILLLLWEQWQGREFRCIVKSTATHHAYRYAHVPYQRLLYVARPNEKPDLTGERMRMGPSLFGVWNMVATELTQLTRTVAELLRRKRNVNVDDEGDA